MRHLADCELSVAPEPALERIALIAFPDPGDCRGGPRVVSDLPGRPDAAHLKPQRRGDSIHAFPTSAP
jgi:hypothetical protein